MIQHYVTLFDSLFMPQALALYRSMLRHAEPFRLWALCMDGPSHVLMNRLKLPNLIPLALSELETAELKAVRGGRTAGEYCWTVTPFAPQFVFDADSSVSRVTYLDADMWFLRNPAPLFSEFEQSGKSVLITEHAYAAQHDRSAQSGRFCVQFVVFQRSGSQAVLEWWSQRCLEWCFDRIEPGRFGDQKYLDLWPELFGDDVHILRQQDLLSAPWNVSRFDGSSAVAFHFHSLRLLSMRSILRTNGAYALPRSVLKGVYEPYGRDLKAAVGQLLRAGHVVRSQVNPWRGRMLALARRTRGLLRGDWAW